MAEVLSALAAIYAPGPVGAVRQAPGVTLRERPHRTSIQVSGWPGGFDAICDKIAARLGMLVPVDCLTVTTHDDVSILRVASTRLWFACDAGSARLRDFLATLAAQDAVVTEIGHSRTVLRLSGPQARTLLNRGLPIDLDDSAFPENVFAQSVIHRILVLVHRLASADDTVFDIHVPRDHAVSFWQWLCEAAAPLGGQILERA